MSDTNTKTPSALDTFIFRLRKCWRSLKAGLITGALLGLIYAPGASFGLILAILCYQGGLFPVALALYGLIRNRARLVRLWQKRKRGSGMYYGTRKEKLVEYLLNLEDSGETFSRDKVMDEFFLSRTQCEKLTKALDKEGIFERDGNNGRRVRKLSSDQLAEILKAASEGFISGRNRLDFTKSREWKLGELATRIKARLDSPPPSPFEIRPIR